MQPPSPKIQIPQSKWSFTVSYLRHIQTQVYNNTGSIQWPSTRLSYINIISGVQEAGGFNQKKNVTLSLIVN